MLILLNRYLRFPLPFWLIQCFKNRCFSRTQEVIFFDQKKVLAMHDQTLFNENNGTFYYCFDDAVEVIFKNLPNPIRFKYTWEDVMLILEIKDEYYDICSQHLSDDTICEFPIEIDEQKLRDYILLQTRHNDLEIEEADLIEILDAELAYFEQHGALRDAGEYLN